jgi:hypothetical protein
MGIRLCLCALLLAGAALFAGRANAAYAQLTPPAGWSLSGTQGMLNMQAANASVMNNRAVLNVTTSVGGRMVTMPASMRFASNAGQVAMTALRLNPAVAIGSTAALAFMMAYGLWYADDQWRTMGTQSIAGHCTTSNNPFGTGAGSYCAPSQAGAVALAVDQYNANRLAVFNACPRVGTWVCTLEEARVDPTDTTSPINVQRRTRSSDYTGYNGPFGAWGFWQQTTTTATTYEEEVERPAVDGDFVHPGDPLPDDLPEVVPVPLPVEVPVLNPSDDPMPLPQPLRVPLGEPVPVPGSDPAQWEQPVADIVPANRTSDPWRVDVQPKTIIHDNPDGLEDPETPSEGDPVGTPKEDQKQLCEAYPDIAACQKLGEAPASETIPVIDTPASIDERVTFGPETAACPADRVMNTTLAGTLHFSWSGACMFADGIRPIVVGMAYLAAVLSLFGLGRRE